MHIDNNVYGLMYVRAYMYNQSKQNISVSINKPSTKKVKKMLPKL